MGVPIRGAGRITCLGGAAIVALAWMVGVVGLPPSYQAVTAVLAEVLGCLALILAWRFARSRLALAAVMVALANSLLRGPLTGAGAVENAALAVALPLNLAVLALVRDGALVRVATLAHLGAIAAQPWLWWVVLVGSRQGRPEAPWVELVRSPQTALLAFLVATAVSAVAFAVRRGAFEGGLLVVLAACAAAVLGGQVERSTLMLAAAQLVLLFALVEDFYRLAYHDPLTGLPGRRALDDAFHHLDGSYALAMVDVDHFKRFNDRYGHDAGDEVLRMVAEQLRAVGGGGRAFRYGGEEFAVVFAGCQPEEAEAPLQGLRAGIANRPFVLRSPERPSKKPRKADAAKPTSQRVSITVSIGLAGVRRDRSNPEEVLVAADKALYRAKAAGRNRLVSG